MSATESFTYFRALPPELRFQIWREALSLRSVWAAVRTRCLHSDFNNVSHPSFTMVYIGPAPYLAGLSTREARRLLEQTYNAPLRGPLGEQAKPAGRYWVDLDTTVVHLGDPLDATTVLSSFGADELSKFQHVALSWYQFGMLARTCQRLSAMCPAVRTIILHRCELEAATTWTLCQPLALDTAAYYATLPDSATCDWENETLDVHHLRSLLLPYFGDSPPRLHVLPVDPARRLSETRPSDRHFHCWKKMSQIM